MKKLSLLVVLLLSGITFLAIADDTKEEAQQMPPMGPPEQMKESAYLVGTWDADTKILMDPSTDEWTDAKAVSVYEYVAGGACMQMTYTSSMMGMEFHGVSMSVYDREMGEWHDTWVDNMSGRISNFTGNFIDGNMVMTGEDIMMGQKTLKRMTVSDITDTTFNWKMETSYDDGATWSTGMTASYTKRK